MQQRCASVPETFGSLARSVYVKFEPFRYLRSNASYWEFVEIQTTGGSTSIDSSQF